MHFRFSLIILFSLFTSNFCLLSSVFSQSDKATLLPGTSIPVKVVREIKSNDDAKSESVFIVASDITDAAGNILITANSPVKAATTNALPGKFGSGGEIKIEFKSTVATDGQQILLSGNYNSKGKTRLFHSLALGIPGVGLAVAGLALDSNKYDGRAYMFFGGLALIGLAWYIPGKQAEIPAETIIDNVYASSAFKIKTVEKIVVNQKTEIPKQNSPSLSEKGQGDEVNYRGGGDPLKGLNVSKAQPMVIGNYYALIIGIDNYKGAWNKLKNAVNDAKAVEALLKSEYKIDQCKTLYNEAATRNNIIAELESLSKNVKATDNVLIYYSGHGEFKKEYDKGYWVPVDAITNTTAAYISNNDLQTFLSGIKSKHTLLISDACFSGDVMRGNTISVPFEESEKYYNTVSNKISRKAITSGSIEPVMDGGKDGHSVFTYYFLKTLMQNQSKYFDASQLYENLKIPVINNSDQTPQFNAIKNTGDEGGQFIFIKK